MVPILNAPVCCPSCGHTQPRPAGGGTPMHACPGMAGLVVPLVPEGTRAEHRAVEREDYVAGADVRLDGNGRPVMHVRTVRDDGEDLTVYAPTAHVEARA